VLTPTELTLSTSENFPSNSATPLAAFTISAVGVTTLLQPATVTINYGLVSVIGLNPNANIQMYQLMSNGYWTLLPSTLNAAAYSDSVTTTTLGTFAVVAN
jgi:hypothetical protein